MTQEEKELLLKDLCARLPYGIFVKENRESLDDGPTIYTFDYHPCVDNCKPYLRPMSSMTEEEKKTLNNILEYQYCSDDSCMCESTDWLNSHHFDYRGLIPMGIAIEAPEEMYKMETQELTERLSKQELTQKLDAIRSDIQWMYTPNRPLCKKPSQEKLKERFGFDRLDSLRHDVFKGSHMRTYRFGADENVWTFPDGVEKKIEDDKDYKVWYTWHDASDSADMSTYHHVYYIEEVSAGKMVVLQFLKQLISEID